MRKIFTFLFFSCVLNIIQAQNNVGIGTNAPLTKLDVVGDLALREGTAIAVSGASPAVAVPLTTAPDNSFYRITGAPTGTMTLNSIANGVDGQIITIINATSIKLRISNNNAANGILTSGGATTLISPNGSFTLQYSTGAGRWYVTNAAGATLADWTVANTIDEPAIKTDDQYVTGKIGIGDFSASIPTDNIDVVSTSATNGITIRSTGINASVLKFFDGTTQKGGIGMVPAANSWVQNGARGDLFLRSETNGKLFFDVSSGANNPAAMMVNTTGNIGINAYNTLQGRVTIRGNASSGVGTTLLSLDGNAGGLGNKVNFDLSTYKYSDGSGVCTGTTVGTPTFRLQIEDVGFWRGHINFLSKRGDIGSTDCNTALESRLFIKASTDNTDGYTGINTAVPYAQLDVSANGSSYDATNIANIFTTRHADNSQHHANEKGSSFIGMKSGNTGDGFTGMKMQVLGTAEGAGTNNVSRITFQTWGNSISTSRDVVMINEFGNVGIGITAPANKLHVFGNNSKIIIDNGANATSEIGIEFRNGDASASQPKSAIISKGYNSWKRANMYFVLDGAADDGPYDLTADTKMIILAESGNVGIGTLSPVRKLEVNNVMKFTNSSSDANDGVVGTAPFAPGLNLVGINTDATNRKISMWGGITQQQNDLGNFFLNNNYFQGVGNIYIGNPGASSNPTILPRNPIGGANATYLRLGDASNSLQDLYSNFIYVNNRVHIGGTSPTNYPLLVEGSNSWTGWNRWYDDGYGSSWSGWSSATATVAIYSPRSIMTDDYFIAASDKRIKKDFNISDSKTDLQTINNIQITNYKLIDSISTGNRPFKKVIAQQVETVYPAAISNTVGFIPNIYAASIKSELLGKKIILTMSKAHELKSGEKVKVYDEKGNQIQNEVVVLDEFSFSMESDDIKESGPYFVFGKEVNDYKSVDYDALGMLNISATQELAKQLEAAKSEIEGLIKENDTLKASKANTSDIEKLKAENTEIKAQIDELKKLVLNTGLKAEK